MTGLEALKVVERDCEDLEQVPYGEFATIEKSLKALEIIKGKTVSIFQLSCCKNVNEYNDLRFKFSEKLTKEEFSLLKEVLE